LIGKISLLAKPLPISPLAPGTLAQLEPIGGVRLAVAETGTKYHGRPDLLLALFDPQTSVAGVLTRSKAPSAPVDWCRRYLPQGRADALLVNAGNANAFTGKLGKRSTQEVAKGLANAAGCAPDKIFLASTGVIGEPLASGPLVAPLPQMVSAAAPTGWHDAARAIMTTDTFAKVAQATTRIAGRAVRINGIAKGSGMIAPDMATMLSFIFTDADIAPDILQGLLVDSVERSFNATTVDGDTSTSDTVLAFATGAAGNVTVNAPDDAKLRGFARALDAVCRDLAHQVVRDGEGAQKFISIDVRGAEDDGAARRIGLAVANSPLVKTAIAGEDANWGRIVMAVGKSGEAADRDKLSIWIGGVRVATRGAVDRDYVESEVVPHMKGTEIDIRVNVGVGRGRATVWTCDLTHGYISINADYRS
jgi:glutamate N-acetyltransferase/amino-acid N-acetyltransferase